MFLNFLKRNKKRFCFAWIGVSTFLYFEHLAHHPKTFVEYFHLSSFYDHFEYEDDLDRQEEAMAYAEAHGHGAEAKYLLATGFRFLKPLFSLPGYLYVIFSPIVFLWLLLWLLKRIKAE